MTYQNISVTVGKFGVIIDGINVNFLIKRAHLELSQNTINKQSVVVIRNQIGLAQISLVEIIFGLANYK